MVTKQTLRTDIWLPEERWSNWVQLFSTASAYECALHKPAELTDYNAHLIAYRIGQHSFSKTLFDGNNSTRTQQHTEDGYNKYLLFFLDSGSGYLQRKNEIVPLKQDVIYLVDMAQPIQSSMVGKTNMTSVHIPRREIEDLIAGPNDQAILYFNANTASGWLLKNYLQLLPYSLSQYANAPEGLYHPVFSLVRSLLLEDKDETPDKDQCLLIECRKLIRIHLSDENFNVDKISTLMQMSRSGFLRFMKRVDASFSDELSFQRANLAQQKLNDGYPFSMTQLACECGFRSSSQFSRSFKHRVGCTPSEYAAGFRTADR
ncbi:helix-turn-helix domain-containing protein [Bacterioplanoides pacificum]|uniref:Helix-turn-helix domain-containing protein n=1 Tax=Bacterioplanoides pacificum TaxID=1171596 RepID=A0ABV7VU98_9GAMM